MIMKFYPGFSAKVAVRVITDVYLVELYTVSPFAKKEDVVVHRKRELTEPEMEASRLELEAIKAAENETELPKAIALLTRAIELAPEYPSPYNNRAQVYRLGGQKDLALSDLNRAIELSMDFPDVRRQALCQRAWVLHSKDKLEDAYRDFEEAGKLGSEDARKMAVRCNPYARLCNNIMQEMLSRLYYSQPTDQR